MAAVTDIAKWEAVLNQWELAGHSLKNVGGLIDWYVKGVPEYKRQNGREQKSRSREWRNDEVRPPVSSTRRPLDPNAPRRKWIGG